MKATSEEVIALSSAVAVTTALAAAGLGLALTLFGADDRCACTASFSLPPPSYRPSS